MFASSGHFGSIRGTFGHQVRVPFRHVHFKSFIYFGHFVLFRVVVWDPLSNSGLHVRSHFGSSTNLWIGTLLRKALLVCGLAG